MDAFVSVFAEKPAVLPPDAEILEFDFELDRVRRPLTSSGAGTDAFVSVFAEPAVLPPDAEILALVFELDRVRLPLTSSGAGADAFRPMVPVSPLAVATSLPIAQALSLKRGPIALTPLQPRGVRRFPFSSAVALGAKDIC